MCDPPVGGSSRARIQGPRTMVTSSPSDHSSTKSSRPLYPQCRSHGGLDPISLPHHGRLDFSPLLDMVKQATSPIYSRCAAKSIGISAV
jgi:hypothetical protein